MRKKKDSNRLTFAEHIDALRFMLCKIVIVVTVLSIVVFCFKDTTFSILFAPKDWQFITYRLMEDIVNSMGISFRFAPYKVDLISTELSAQFMTHISTSMYLGLLLASPYILFELFRFVMPALYKNEKRTSIVVAISMYLLFAVGVFMNYYIIFPISFRFLGTYQVAENIANTITLSSYIKTFSTLTFVLGLIFQLPVAAFILAKMNVLKVDFLRHYRRHAFVAVLIVSAIITPPDVFTLILVSLPMYLLYECCILIVARTKAKV